VTRCALCGRFISPRDVKNPVHFDCIERFKARLLRRGNWQLEAVR
jgi:hypothetical protein